MNNTDTPVGSWASNALFDLQQQWQASQKSANKEMSAAPSQNMLDDKENTQEVLLLRLSLRILLFD
jgi:hypothetical protein